MRECICRIFYLDIGNCKRKQNIGNVHMYICMCKMKSRTHGFECVCVFENMHAVLYIGRVIILIIVYCLLTLCLRRSSCGYRYGINNHMHTNQTVCCAMQYKTLAWACVDCGYTLHEHIRYT